ncbi:MAG: hypothetical protein ACK4OM_04655 [Alphaproteobacteria bacterium]
MFNNSRNHDEHPNIIKLIKNFDISFEKLKEVNQKSKAKLKFILQDNVIEMLELKLLNFEEILDLYEENRNKFLLLSHPLSLSFIKNKTFTFKEIQNFCEESPGDYLVLIDKIPYILNKWFNLNIYQALTLCNNSIKNVITVFDKNVQYLVELNIALSTIIELCGKDPEKFKALIHPNMRVFTNIFSLTSEDIANIFEWPIEKILFLSNVKYLCFIKEFNISYDLLTELYNKNPLILEKFTQINTQEFLRKFKFSIENLLKIYEGSSVKFELLCSSHCIRFIQEISINEDKIDEIIKYPVDKLKYITSSEALTLRNYFKVTYSEMLDLYNVGPNKLKEIYDKYVASHNNLTLEKSIDECKSLIRNLISTRTKAIKFLDKSFRNIIDKEIFSPLDIALSDAISSEYSDKFKYAVMEDINFQVSYLKNDNEEVFEISAKAIYHHLNQYLSRQNLTLKTKLKFSKFDKEFKEELKSNSIFINKYTLEEYQEIGEIFFNIYEASLNLTKAALSININNYTDKQNLQTYRLKNPIYAAQESTLKLIKEERAKLNDNNLYTTFEARILKERENRIKNYRIA